jgi:hypothetical protein
MNDNRALILQRRNQDVRILHAPPDILTALVEFRDRIRQVILDTDLTWTQQCDAVAAECDSIIVTTADGRIVTPKQLSLEPPPSRGPRSAG